MEAVGVTVLAGDQAGQRLGVVEDVLERIREHLAVAEDHGGGHRLADRPTDPEQDRRRNARKCCGERDRLHRLPLGESHRHRAIAHRVGYAGERVVGDRNDRRQCHQADHEADQKQAAEVGHLQVLVEERVQHDEAEVAVDDRGNARQDLDAGFDRLPDQWWGDLREKQGGGDPQRGGDRRRNEGRHERPPDHRDQRVGVLAGAPVALDARDERHAE